MDELKPCPNCGSRLVMKCRKINIKEPKDYKRFIPNFLIPCKVFCLVCGYTEKSVRAWNRRKNGND